MGDGADDAIESMMNADDYYISQTGMGIYEDEYGDILRPVFGHPRIKPTGPGPCPRCGAPTKQRHRKSDMKTFYGCSTYPKCKGSRGS